LHKKGVPDTVVVALRKEGISMDDLTRDPNKTREVLYQLDREQVFAEHLSTTKNNSDEITIDSVVSPPSNVVHCLSLKFNQETSKLEGIPSAVYSALTAVGLTEETVLKDEKALNTAKEILYGLDYQQVLLGKAPDSEIYDSSSEELEQPQWQTANIHKKLPTIGENKGRGEPTGAAHPVATTRTKQDFTKKPGNQRNQSSPKQPSSQPQKSSFIRN